MDFNIQTKIIYCHVSLFKFGFLLEIICLQFAMFKGINKNYIEKSSSILIRFPTPPPTPPTPTPPHFFLQPPVSAYIF